MPIDPNDDLTPLLLPARKTAQFVHALALRHTPPIEGFTGEVSAAKLSRVIDKRPGLQATEPGQVPMFVGRQELSQPRAPQVRTLERPHLDLSLSRPPVPIASWLGLSPPAPEQMEREAFTLSPAPSRGKAMRTLHSDLPTISSLERLGAINYAEHEPMMARALSSSRPTISSRPALLHTAAAMITPAAEKALVAMQMPAPSAPMEQKIPPMPLFRAGDVGKEMRGDGLMIQRSAVGEHPAGNAESSTKDDASAAAESQSAQGDGGAGGGSDVTLLAGEVWALLKRRLAVEAERSGRR